MMSRPFWWPAPTWPLSWPLLEGRLISYLRTCSIAVVAGVTPVAWQISKPAGTTRQDSQSMSSTRVSWKREPVLPLVQGK